jgi:hypothetical protein
MYVATHDSLGRQAAALLIAVPFALLACSGDEKTQSTVAVAEASPVTVDTPTVSVESAGTTVSPEAAFETPLAAYNAGEYRIAADMYRRHVDTKPNEGYSHYMLGLASWKRGFGDGAEDSEEPEAEVEVWAFGASGFEGSDLDDSAGAEESAVLLLSPVPAPSGALLPAFA